MNSLPHFERNRLGDQAFWQAADTDELSHFRYTYEVRLANLAEEIAEGYPEHGVTAADIHRSTGEFLKFQLALISDEMAARERASRRGVLAPGPRYGTEIIAELKRRVPLDVALEFEVGAVLSPVTSKGIRSGPCPWCGGNPQSNRFKVFLQATSEPHFHCFSCGRHGELIALIMERHGLSFPAAVRYLAEGSGVVLPSEPARTPRVDDLGFRPVRRQR